MAINIGAMFAPTAAIKIMKWAQESLSVSVEDSYHFAFAVACASLIFSIAIYYAFSFTYKHVLASETKSKDDKTSAKETNELSKAETKERIICLCLVFAVVIFFWMAFHQNGNTLTLFARDYTQKTSEGLQSMAFDVTNLVACILWFTVVSVWHRARLARERASLLVSSLLPSLSSSTSTATLKVP